MSEPLFDHYEQFDQDRLRFFGWMQDPADHSRWLAPDKKALLSFEEARKRLPKENAE